MTGLFEDIKTKTKSIKPSPRCTEVEPKSEAEVSGPLPKRGRPKKEGTTHPSKTPEEKHPGQGKSDKVTYLSRETKALLQKVKAMMLISTGQSLDESAIVAMALDCFIEHNKLEIK